MSLEIFTDGSPGPKTGLGWAGWAFVLMDGGLPVYEACGTAAERLTTNQIELAAVAQALAFVLRTDGLPDHLPVWTDSLYVAEAVGRLPRLAFDQFEEGGRPVVNAPQLRLLYDLLYVFGLAGRTIIRHVKGHNGTTGNELADRLSKLAAYQGESVWRDNRRISQDQTSIKHE